jgi:hypothetical protein
MRRPAHETPEPAEPRSVDLPATPRLAAGARAAAPAARRRLDGGTAPRVARRRATPYHGADLGPGRACHERPKARRRARKLISRSSTARASRRSRRGSVRRTPGARICPTSFAAAQRRKRSHAAHSSTPTRAATWRWWQPEARTRRTGASTLVGRKGRVSVCWLEQLGVVRSGRRIANRTLRPRTRVMRPRSAVRFLSTRAETTHAMCHSNRRCTPQTTAVRYK